MSSGSRMSKRSARMARTSRRTSFPSYTTPSSAEIVAEIDDILIQILSFLPVKALLRSKCVSKRWLSLITKPEFSLRVISSKPRPISGLFLRRKFTVSTSINYEFLSLDDTDDDDDDEEEEEEEEEESDKRSIAPPFKSQLRFADHPSDMIILQSCNGLLLCRCSCPNQTDPNYYVYNPTTKQNTLIPPITRHSKCIHGISLAFDPSKSPHYRVVCLRASDKTSFDLCQIEVYSSNTGPWRLSGPPFSLPSNVEFRNTVFWNGAVHWFGDWGDCISFDIEQEEIRILPLPHPGPEDEQDTRAFRFLDESRGHLHFIDVYDSGSSQFWVYEMERDCSGWSLKYNVDLEPLAAAFPELVRTENYTNRHVYAFSVVCIVRGDIEEDSFIVLHIPNKAVRYNFRDKTFKKMRDFGLPSDDIRHTEFFGFHGSFQFVQSLACI